MKSEMIRLEIPPHAEVDGKRVVEIGFPDDVLVLLINRRGDYIVPHGGTILQAGDMVSLLGGKDSLARVRDQLQRVRARANGETAGG